MCLSVSLPVARLLSQEGRVLGLAGGMGEREGKNAAALWTVSLTATLNCLLLLLKSLQSCSTLGDPIDGSPPGSPVPRILQARILEWPSIMETI